MSEIIQAVGHGAIGIVLFQLVEMIIYSLRDISLAKNGVLRQGYSMTNKTKDNQPNQKQE